jgi:tetratricopeptide (TPR) repeat protein
MSSLSTKANKSRSASSRKIPAKSIKKAVTKKAKTSLASKVATKSKAITALKAKKQAATSKKAVAKKPIAKLAVSSKAKKSTAKNSVLKGSPVKPKTPVGSKAQALKKGSRKVEQKVVKAPEIQPKKTSSQAAIAAMSAFEQALKFFNKHNYSAAKDAFERMLQKFGDQAEVVVGARKYIAICEQRLARTRAIPKNPDALYDQGVFELNNANVQEAINLFEKALKAQPVADHILYSLAAAYARLQNNRKSLDALNRAISIQPVNRSRARSDVDFASLYNDEEFQQITGYGLLPEE